MTKAFLILLLSISANMGYAQTPPCPELLSQAEQAYRDGRFEEIKPKLCKCFGIYNEAASDQPEDIKPAKFKSMIAEMRAADSTYAEQLGSFKGYAADFILTKKAYKERQDDFFSYAERARAFLLLGKLYNQLGVVRLADFFALKSILINPSNDLNNDNSGFNRIYSNEFKRVGEWSIGPAVGWFYTLTTAAINNLPGTASYHYQTDGKIALGGQVSYNLRPYLILQLNLLINSTRIIYSQNWQAPAGQFDFYMSEKQNWIRMPLLLKFTSPRHLRWLKTNDAMQAKIFFATGFSFSYLTVSKATLLDLPGNTALYDYNVTPIRNRVNFEYIFQVLSRFTVGHNYLNVGFSGAYLLNRVVKQNRVSSPDNPLYAQYGIRENSYKIMTGTWTVYYEFRHTRIKKVKGLPSFK